MSSDIDGCLTCGQPVRPFTTPIPENTEVTLTEAFTGRAHYCQPCFDEMEGPTDG